jgi:hypothetical protein
MFEGPSADRTPIPGREEAPPGWRDLLIFDLADEPYGLTGFSLWSTSCHVRCQEASFT